MARSLALWIGATDDTPAPPRVRLRVWDRCEGRCHRCTRKIPTGDAWVLEHLKAVINGGRNAEDNLGLSCSWCVPAKNAEDVADKSEVATIRKKHLGIKERKGQPIPGSKASGWRKPFNGPPVRRPQ